MQTVPWMVLNLHTNPTDPRAIEGWIAKCRVQAGSFPHEQEHRKTSKEVERG
jgi:hypothetical protein